MKLPWSNIANALGYQAVWLATMVSVYMGHFWYGFFTSMVFAGLTLCFGGKAKQDGRIVLIGLTLGVSVDTLFAAGGWIQYAMPWTAISIAPLWIIALWLSFSFTLNHSMAFLRGNYVVAAVFGLIGGPLAYWCADRLFNVIEYGTDISVVMIGLGLCWGIVIPGIFFIDRQISVMGNASKAAV